MSAVGSAAHSGGEQQEGPPYKLYIAGVPKNYTVEQLQPTFDPHGEVVSAVILIEKGGTGLSRGCAFISYATEAQAQAAVDALDNQLLLPGAPYNMRVRFAQKPKDQNAPLSGPPASNVLTEVDRRRLFFTRGPPGIQAVTINTAFGPFGEIEEINLFPERDQNTTKGCGFVQYLRHEDAAAAMSQLQGSLQLEFRRRCFSAADRHDLQVMMSDDVIRTCTLMPQGVSQKLTVTWADPERRMLKRKFQDGNFGGQPAYHKPMTDVAPGEEREVFFAKIPRSATEQQLGELFTRHGGPVERVKIFTAIGSPHHKCCGLATFVTHHGASNAILALDGVYLWPKFTDPMVVKWMDHSMSKTRRVAMPGTAPGQAMNGSRMPRPASGPYASQQQQYQPMPQLQQQMTYGQHAMMYGHDQYGFSQRLLPATQHWQHQQMAAQPIYGHIQGLSQKPAGQLQQQAYGQAASQQQAVQQATGPPAMYNANGQHRQAATAQQAIDSYAGQLGATAQATPSQQQQQQPQQYVGTQAYPAAQPAQAQYQDAQQQPSGLSSYGQASSLSGAASAGYQSAATGASQLFPI